MTDNKSSSFINLIINIIVLIIVIILFLIFNKKHNIEPFIIESSNSTLLNDNSLNGNSLNNSSLNNSSLNGNSLNGNSLNGNSSNSTLLNDNSLNGNSLNDNSLNNSSLNGNSLNGNSLNGNSLNNSLTNINTTSNSLYQVYPIFQYNNNSSSIDTNSNLSLNSNNISIYIICQLPQQFKNNTNYCLVDLGCVIINNESIIINGIAYLYDIPLYLTNITIISCIINNGILTITNMYTPLINNKLLNKSYYSNLVCSNSVTIGKIKNNNQIINNDDINKFKGNIYHVSIYNLGLDNSQHNIKLTELISYWNIPKVSNNNVNTIESLTLSDILNNMKSDLIFLLDPSILKNNYSSIPINYSSLDWFNNTLSINNNKAVLTNTLVAPVFNNNSITLNNSTGGLVIKNVIINEFTFFIVCNLSETLTNHKYTDYCLFNLSNNNIYIGTDKVKINTYDKFTSYNNLLINNYITIISGLISNNIFYLYNMEKIINWGPITNKNLNNTPIDIFIGSNSDGKFIFPGSICEIIIFNKYINFTLHTNIILELKNKWNITSENTLHHIIEKPKTNQSSTIQSSTNK